VGVRVAEKCLGSGESRLNRGRPGEQILQQCGVDSGRRLGSKDQDPRFGAVMQTRLLIVNDPEPSGGFFKGRKKGESVVEEEGGREEELLVSAR
jgi:hypothetical protein